MQYLAKNMTLLVPKFGGDFFLSKSVFGYFKTKKKQVVGPLVEELFGGFPNFSIFPDIISGRGRIRICGFTSLVLLLIHLALCIILVPYYLLISGFRIKIHFPGSLISFNFRVP